MSKETKQQASKVSIPRTRAEKEEARALYEERLIAVASRIYAGYASNAARSDAMTLATAIEQAAQLIGECRSRVSVIEFL